MPQPSIGERELPVGAKMKRPRLDIPRTQLEVVCELIAAAAVIGTLAYLAAIWSLLPARIPAHFNFAGEVDRWAGRNSLLSLLGVMLAMYSGFTILQRFPHIYNYPFGLTPENVHRQYQLARQLLTLVKALIVCIFGFMQWQMIQVAEKQSGVLSIWIMPVMIVALVGITLHYFVQAARAK